MIAGVKILGCLKLELLAQGLSQRPTRNQVCRFSYVSSFGRFIRG